MFWNDPTLYGASFPYKELNTQVQSPFLGPVFTPWQNMSRYVPPIYGFNQPFFNVPTLGIHPQFQNPYLNQFPINQPIMQHLPVGQGFVQPFDPNLRMFNCLRPFC